MNWKGPKPIQVGEAWRDCFAWIPRRIAQLHDGSWHWIWLEPYRERLVGSRDGASFDIEREAGGIKGRLTDVLD